MTGPLIPVDTADGWTLHLEEHPAAAVGGTPAAARGALLFSHGMMVNRRSLDRPPGRGMLSFFRRRGFHVYALDLRGHGASGPKAAHGGDWTYDDIVQRDLPAAIRAVRRRHPDLPLGFIGHSLSAHGGAVALGLEPDLPVDAAILVSPVLWIRSHEPSTPWWLYKRLMLEGWWALTRLVGHTPARRLGIGSEDEAPGYVHQFPRWARDDRWLGEDLGAGAAGAGGGAGVGVSGGRLDYLAALARVRGPVLVVNARGDRWICRTPSVARFARAMAGAEVELRELGRAELPELPREPGHMTLVTDRRSRPAWEAMADWLEGVLEAAGPGVTRAAASPPAG